jgi:hypothetical protein
VIARGPGEGVTSEGYGLETMPSQDADSARRAAPIARGLATPFEVAEYLQVPVKTLYTWRYKRLDHGRCRPRPFSFAPPSP